MGQPSLEVPVGGRSVRAAGGATRLLRRIGAIDEIGVIGALIAICVFLTIRSDKFLTAKNLIGVSRQASYIGIMAVGMVFVIAMGDIDLSVGSMLMLCTVAMALALKHDYNIFVAIAICLLVGAACGFVNGVLSVVLRIPTIIVTLGTLSMYRGFGLVLTNATQVTGYNVDTWFFNDIGEKVFHVWTSVWVMLMVGVCGWILFNHTAFGRRVQAIGSNRLAARFSGVRIPRYRIIVMTLMGFFVGVASVVVLAFQQAGNPTTGQGAELFVIAATIIGGTALTGGSGSVLGAILGAIIIQLIQNGLALLHVTPYWATAVTGMVIIAAVTLDYLIKRR